ncbi:hypothetical protein P43SY_010375 [Pythium insidiosum]|uniref:ribonuclease Z n=1 Tax=Pythium insidiosum TaxID=114742 RepID=A0AAD5Q1I7_PYTIN|nr:hypothetical protein P43SY_010375 [Pythium insidiosum]KAJ0395282.1 hypothetical protein ATCC90586_011553 [Pythium insidiosum]
MVVSVQVLSVASAELAPSLLITSESQRILVDVGDGTQRLCMEHRLRLFKLTQVLLTEIATHTVGGLPGMVLTVSGSGKEGLRLYGPEGTTRFVHATRHFVYRPDFQLQRPSAMPQRLS